MPATGEGRRARLGLHERFQRRHWRVLGDQAAMTCKSHPRHGHSVGGRVSRTYDSWRDMRKRCENKNSGRFYCYGGRGIAVCERWKLFDNFLADMGECPLGMQIDRIDNNGNYEPGNCRWVTRLDNLRNTSKVKLNTEAVKVIRALAGTRTKTFLARLHGVTYWTVRDVLNGKVWSP